MEQTKPKRPVLGILGGLGPAASCYLYQMLIDHTPAVRDQDHIDLVLSSRASTPDRTAFILGKSDEDPFTVMEQDGESLVAYGATVLAIPCNTAHYFYDRLSRSLPVPVLNMVQLTARQAKRWAAPNWVSWPPPARWPAAPTRPSVRRRGCSGRFPPRPGSPL